MNLVCGWIKGGCISGICLATPCSSWSVALHGPPGSGWEPVRSPAHIYGLPNLPPKAALRLATGNKLARTSSRILRLALSLSIPCALENPASSLLWRFPPIAKAASKWHADARTFDMCGFGARWRKRTKILLWFAADFPPSRLCQGRKGVCSFSNKHHIIVQGRDPASGTFWSTIAQTYPSSLCTAIARCLTNASVLKDIACIKSFCGLRPVS